MLALCILQLVGDEIFVLGEIFFFFEAWMKICQDHHSVVCFLEKVLLD